AYYDATGQISGNRITTILLNRLDRADLYWQEGKLRAYDAQLQAFINQVQGFAPVQIDQVAADALAHEAMLLRELP
ncbi:MAG: FIMAH domain-containing protein, partial [Candidatus Promineifilaceae bacterium]